jgi:hypothetical protein
MGDPSEQGSGFQGVESRPHQAVGHCVAQVLPAAIAAYDAK